MSAPSTVTQGVGVKFTVTVIDAYGNVATGYSEADRHRGVRDAGFGRLSLVRNAVTA